MAYRVQGTDLFHEGKKLHLVGANLAQGFELKEMVPFVLGWGNRTIKEMVSDFKGVGLNAVRVPVHPRVLKNPELPRQDMLKGEDRKYTRALDLLDAVLSEFQNQGIRFMIDVHYLDANGKIPHLWYDKDYPESQWYEDLEFIAKRWKGMRAFYAIDTKNEPNNNGITWGSGDPRTDWKIACKKAAAIIFKANPDIITIHETGGTIPGLDQMLDLDVDWTKNAISSHPYGPDVQRDWFAGAKSPNFPSNMPGEWDKIFGNAARKVCFVAGEWGGRYGLPAANGDYGWGKDKDRLWQDAFAKYARERGFATFYWCYGPDSWDSGGLLKDNRQEFHPEKVRLIQSLITTETTFLTDRPIVDVPEVIVDPITPDNDVVVDSEIELLEWVRFSTGHSEIDQLFSRLAEKIVSESQRAEGSKAEMTAALRKLLEAKDATVRATL